MKIRSGRQIAEVIPFIFCLQTEISKIGRTARHALVHHHAVELEQAERLYRQVLQKKWRHADVSHNLGVLLIHAGKPGAGLAYLQAAVEINSAKHFRLR